MRRSHARERSPARARRPRSAITGKRKQRLKTVSRSTCVAAGSPESTTTAIAAK